MLGTNLILFGYSLIELNTPLSVPVFFLTSLAMLGLKEVAVSLADPFGTDAIDFDTDYFLSRILSQAKALIDPSAAYKPTSLPFPPDKPDKPTPTRSRSPSPPPAR